MRTVSQLDVPQAREAPAPVLRALAEVHPDLTLVHSREGKWWLLRYAPDTVNRRVAETMLATWKRAMKAGTRITPDALARIKQARFALLGYRTVDVYDVQGEPDGRIVEDVRRAWAAMQNTRESDFLASDDRARQAMQDQAYADAASLDRAKDAHRFMTSLTFGAAAESVRSSQPQRVRSGFVRQSVPSPV